MGSLRAIAGGLTFATALLAGPPVTRLTGEVKAGERLERPLDRGLHLILEPAREASGWNIAVAPAKAPHPDCADLVWLATPPFRFDNQRYLDTSYGKKAAESAGPGTVREVAFLLNCESARRERKLIEIVLWPANHPATVVDAALANLGREPRAKLRLRVVDSHVDAAANRIEWIRFAVEILWPR